MKTLKKILSDFLKNPIWVGWTVFLIFLLIFQFSALQFFISEKENELNKVENEAVHFKNQLEAVLNNSITATEMLSFMEDRGELEDNFDSICHELLKRNQFIDALQLVEGSVIINTYPLIGNESVIGYNILENNNHWTAVQNAIERGELYFEGPFQLKQGGNGIVGRLPIFKNGHFWGFAAVIIRIETLYKAMHMEAGGQLRDYTIQLTRIGEPDLPANRFFPAVADYDKGIYHKMTLDIGDWNLYVKANRPEHWKKATPVALIGFIFAVIFAIFAWYMTLQPIRLRQLV